MANPPVELDLTGHLGGRFVHELLDLIRPQAQSRDYVLVEHRHPSWGDRTHGQLLMPRGADLADRHDNQRRAKPASHPGTHGDPAPGHGYDDGIRKIAAKGHVLTQHSACMDAVSKQPAAAGNGPSLSRVLLGVDHDAAVVFGVVTDGDGLPHLYPGPFLRGGEGDPGRHLERLAVRGLDAQGEAAAGDRAQRPLVNDRHDKRLRPAVERLQVTEGLVGLDRVLGLPAGAAGASAGGALPAALAPLPRRPARRPTRREEGLSPGWSGPRRAGIGRPCPCPGTALER